MIRARIACLAILAALSGPLGAAARNRVAAEGAAIDCVPIVQIERTDVRDDRAIDFHLRGGRVVRNILPEKCSQLGVDRRFAYDTSLGQLCVSDIVTVFQESPTIRGASCGLGRFQPIAPAAR